jgi:hypothetical protein
MKTISELPEPYRSLAEKRRDGTSDHLISIHCFRWEKTPEGHFFWHSVWRAKSESELPPIPEEK